MFKNILVPLDGSILAECVLPHTIAIAGALKSHVTLLRVLEQTQAPVPIQANDPLNWQLRKSEARGYLEKLAGSFQMAGLSVEKSLLEGRASECIIQFAHTHNIDLVIFSSHGRSGLSPWNVSSVVQKTIQRACASIMIVRAYHFAKSDLTKLRYRRVLVPLDCSKRAESVLPLVNKLAYNHQFELILAHVVRKPEIPRHVPLSKKEIELASLLVESNLIEAERYLEKIQNRFALDIQTRLLINDNVAVALHNLVEQEDVELVILNAHGYTGGTRWPYGSVAASFIAYGTTTLLIVQDLSPIEIDRTQAEIAALEFAGH